MHFTLKKKERLVATLKKKLRKFYTSMFFQFCAFIPVPTAAGVLILISQLLKLKNDILLTESVPEATSPIKIEEDSDDGEEYYKDVTEDKVGYLNVFQKVVD